MRNIVFAALAFVLAGCAGIGAPGGADVGPAFALRNADFEEWPQDGICAAGWMCSMHRDPKSFRFFAGEGAPGGGPRSLCMEPLKREPWALAMQGTFDARLHGKRLRFSLDARVSGVSGRGGGALVKVHDGRGATLLSREKLVTGTQDWQRLSVEIDVPADAAEVEVGGTLIGKGRLCIDNARLEVLR